VVGAGGAKVGVGLGTDSAVGGSTTLGAARSDCGSVETRRTEEVRRDETRSDEARCTTPRSVRTRLLDMRRVAFASCCAWRSGT